MRRRGWGAERRDKRSGRRGGGGEPGRAYMLSRVMVVEIYGHFRLSAKSYREKRLSPISCVQTGGVDMVPLSYAKKQTSSV